MSDQEVNMYGANMPFNAQTLLENIKPQIQSVNSQGKTKEFLIVPKGMKLEDVSDFFENEKEKPDRRTGTIKLDELPSFVEVTNRFKAKESAIFAKCSVGETSVSANVLTIFDYHPEGDDNTNAKFCSHRASYDFPISNFFETWIKNNRRQMEQMDFALFIEEHVDEIVVGDKELLGLNNNLPVEFAEPLQMLEFSKNLELYASEEVKQTNNLSSGEREIKFATQYSDGNGQPVKIPNFFAIRVPLFQGAENITVPVRLRYRKKDGRVVWFYDLYRVDIAFLKAFKEAVAKIKTETELPVYIGSAS